MRLVKQRCKYFCTRVNSSFIPLKDSTEVSHISAFFSCILLCLYFSFLYFRLICHKARTSTFSTSTVSFFLSQQISDDCRSSCVSERRRRAHQVLWFAIKVMVFIVKGTSCMFSFCSVYFGSIGSNIGSVHVQPVV